MVASWTRENTSMREGRHGVCVPTRAGGVAVEMDCTTTIQVDLIKNWNIAWPRLENKDFIMTIGSTRPMEDAARIVYEAYFRIDPEALSAGQSLSETAKEFAERRLQMRRSGWWFAQR